MNKEELIIQKLIKIVANQQKILQKLADYTEPPTEKRDENIDYITHNLVPIVASNLGLKGVSVAVDTPQPGTYHALISGVPTNRRQQFTDAMIRQINAQKPELAKIFSGSFQ